MPPPPISAIDPSTVSTLVLTKGAEPEEVRPGEVITYTLTLTNTGQEALADLTLSDPLPQGVAYVPGSASAGQYDPVAREITWQVPDLAGGETTSLTFQVRVEGGAPNPILNTARLSHADWPRSLTAQASTHVLYIAEAAITPQRGGRLTAPGGRVTLDFPAGAVEQPVQVSYRSLDARRLAPTRTGLAVQFELTARPADAAGGPPITRFQKPLRLTVDFTGLVDVEALGKYKKLFVGYQDEATGRWVPLPVVEQQFDRPVLTVEVDHFSTFGGGADGEVEWGWTLTFNEAMVGRFDGGLGYSYPIQVVAGRAGLTPQLNLSYNSRRMDGVLSWAQPPCCGTRGARPRRTPSPGSPGAGGCGSSTTGWGG